MITAASRMTERTLKDVRSSITEKSIDILAGYRKVFSSSHPPGQLVLPENLKEFAMYMLSLLKNRAFKGTAFSIFPSRPILPCLALLLASSKR